MKKHLKLIQKGFYVLTCQLLFFIILISPVFFIGCDDEDNETNLSYSEIQRTQCPHTNYMNLENRLFFTENEVAEVFETDHYCFSELTESADFENSTLIYLTENVEAGCGESGIETDYLKYNSDKGILYAYLYRWNYQICTGYGVLDNWLVIDRIPESVKLEVIVRDGTYGGDGYGEKQLSYSEIQKTQCSYYPDYQYLKSGLFFTEDEVAEIFGSDHYCFSELAAATDFENSTLFYLGGINTGCNEPADTDIKYLTYDAGKKRLYAHLLRKKDAPNICAKLNYFDNWYVIDKIPEGTKLRISVEDETD